MSEEFGPKYAYFLPEPKRKDAMTRERWQRIKALKPRDKQMFVSCAPDKDKHSRATYRKAERNGQGDG